MSRRWIVSVLIGLMAVGAAAVAGQQSGYDLFQQALNKERAEGKLAEAIALYQRVARDFASDRALAAKALLRQGECQEKLGDQQARKAYEQIVTGYADQVEAVATARARLAALGGGHAPSGPSARRLPSEIPVDSDWRPTPDGRFLVGTDWETGDLATYELSTGVTHRLTNNNWQDGTYAWVVAPAPDSKSVAYGWPGEVGEIRSLPLQGSQPPRTLYRATPALDIVSFVFTRDGRSLCVLGHRQDGTYPLTEVRLADGTSRLVTTFDKDLGPGRFARLMSSPDGRYLAYDRPDRGDFPERDVFVLDLSSGAVHPVVKGPTNDYVFGWSPDGMRLVFVSDRTGALGLWTVPVTDGRPTGVPVLLKGDVGRVTPMGVTASGSMYYQLQTQDPDVYLANIDLRAGTIQTPPTPIDERRLGSKQGPDWSRDGKSFAYVSTDGGRLVIVIRSLETGETRRVALPFIAGDALRWSPDGRSFKLGTRDPANQIGSHVVDAVSGAATLIVARDRTRAYGHQEWLPDGKSLVMVRRDIGGDGAAAVVVRELATGAERSIFTLPKGQIGGIAVSPDGRLVAIGHGTIHVVPVSGGEARLVADHAGPMPGQGSIVWSPDSHYLVFSRMIPKGQGKASVWFVPAEGGEPKQLGLEVFALSDLRIRPDGRQVAFRGGQYQSELWVLENLLTPKNRP